MATIEEEVKALIPQMTADIAAKIRERAFNQLEHTTASAVAEEVKKYVAETIMPLVREDIARQEAELRAAVLAAVKGVAVELCSALVERFKAKLTSYEGDKMIQAIFGPVFRGY